MKLIDLNEAILLEKVAVDIAHRIVDDVKKYVSRVKDAVADVKPDILKTIKGSLTKAFLSMGIDSEDFVHTSASDEKLAQQIKDKTANMSDDEFLRYNKEAKNKVAFFKARIGEHVDTLTHADSQVHLNSDQLILLITKDYLDFLNIVTTTLAEIELERSTGDDEHHRTIPRGLAQDMETKKLVVAKRNAPVHPLAR